jgi:two-component system, LytTR family, response regulator
MLIKYTPKCYITDITFLFLIYNRVVLLSLFSDKIGDFQDETIYTEDEIKKQFLEVLGYMHFEGTRFLFNHYRDILSDWLPEGASIAIAIHDTYVYFASGHANISLTVGSPVPEHSIAYRVIHEQTKIDAMMDTTLFETPYYAIGYPLMISDQPAALVVVLPPLYQSKNNLLELITAKDEDDYIPIEINDIQYFESLQKRTWIYREREGYKTSLTLKELQTRLPSHFVRIHRSYIINMKYVLKVSKDYAGNYVVFLKNGTELSVSQSYSNHLKEALGVK